jgi:dihydrofolate synthase / folylpolyglutamate synthase
MSATYAETLNYIFEKLPMFSRIGKAALKPDLSNTLALCHLLGDPQHWFRSVHIAGTNGKGSVSHGLAAVCAQAGYKTGLYTSPHLVDFRERIRINGVPIPEQWVVDFVARIRPDIERIQPSFFEITVAMAFQWFADEGVDIAVIETGLGGRLDSTNVILPLLSVITNISFDHKDLLGDTLPKIAQEKAGIIKSGVPVIIGEQQDETERVFFEHSVRKQSPLYYAQSAWDLVRQGSDHNAYKAIHKLSGDVHYLETDLAGNYQVHNLKTILTAADHLSILGLDRITIGVTLQALRNVQSATGLMGRWQVLSVDPLIICDVAHNPAGLTEVFEQWKNVPARNKHIIAGFVRDKDVAEALRLFPGNAAYYFTNASIPRALPAEELQCLAAEAGLLGPAYENVAAAIDAAKTKLEPGDALLITGSFFIVGEAISHLGTTR